MRSLKRFSDEWKDLLARKKSERANFLYRQQQKERLFYCDYDNDLREFDCTNFLGHRCRSQQMKLVMRLDRGWGFLLSAHVQAKKNGLCFATLWREWACVRPPSINLAKLSSQG
ncbi:hypothetical protein A2239_02050 [Candidatus Uhrbacteria bacterium RIFOXYA2_FULL_40_9]|nr:MAG: hypothetical protein A2239_02050 [Candidatus Uhrbacteria bacterium RIFOXYA2_FULL_40_9]OGL96980.1 MAG: hypothetical protein A2332_03855 [Candidatus Uhrbacteria bacterium RIFOXYB2_FULL_41_18]HBK34786.1 hypothetical protein [Candidatus Uhrbacteria bacterium]HCB55938.1 hypothetical protein [Candidatus Uhrbacteria bacterium]